jgi:hypothetical protein
MRAWKNVLRRLRPAERRTRARRSTYVPQRNAVLARGIR